MKPFNFSILLIALSVVVMAQVKGIMEPFARGCLDAMGEGFNPIKLQRFTNTFLDYYTLLLILWVPIIAWLGWLFFRRSSGYNFAENLVLHSFLLGFQSFLFILTVPLTAVVGTENAM